MRTSSALKDNSELAGLAELTLTRLLCRFGAAKGGDNKKVISE